MRRILVILVIVIGVIFGAAMILPAVIPTESYRARVETAASDALGREVRLSGPIKLAILPKIQVRAEDVSIANAEGFGDEAFAQMRELRLTLALWPLLQQNIELEEFVLVEPTIRLTQRGGRNNWTFKKEGDAAPTQQADAQGAFIRQQGALPLDASLGDLRIENGALSFTSEQQSFNVTALNLATRLPSVDEPAQLNGDFTLNGEDFRFETGLSSLRALFEGQATDIDLAVASAVLDLDFKGQVEEGQNFAFAGDFTADLQSLPRLAAIAGASLPQGNTYKSFYAEGRLIGEPNRLTVRGTGQPPRGDNALIRFDDITTEGTLTLTYGGARPMVRGRLSMDTLDITPYAGSGERADTQRPSGPMEFSRTPMDLSALGLVDADLNLSVNTLKFQALEVSDVALHAVLDRARLQADLTQFTLYQGRGQATAVANARTATPSYGFNANLDGVSALPLLQAAAGFDRLEGLGTITLDLTSQGASAHDIVNGLNGTSNFRFADGAIKGINLARVLRGVQSALTNRGLPDGFGAQESTDFTSLTLATTLTNGLANANLEMLSPLVRVNGGGVFNLPQQNMDYRITPRAVASLQGQGGTNDLVGIPVPIRLQGSFAQPQIGIDFEAVAQSLLRARLGQAVGGNNANGEPQSLEDTARDTLTNALFGNRNRNQSSEGTSEDSDQTQDEEEDEDPAQQLLRGLLGGG